MDSVKLHGILEKYQKREIDFPTASLQFIFLGCNGAEVILLLEHYKPTEDEMVV